MKVEENDCLAEDDDRDPYMIELEKAEAILSQKENTNFTPRKSQASVILEEVKEEESSCTKSALLKVSSTW